MVSNIWVRPGSVLRRRAESADDAEIARKAEMAERARQAEAARKAEEAERQAEEARKAEMAERARQAEAARKAAEAEERERQAKPVARAVASALAKAIAATASTAATPVKSGGKKCRSGGVSLEELRSRAATWTPPVSASPPTKTELAELEHRVNDILPPHFQGPVSTVPRKMSEEELAREEKRRNNQAFLERVRALDPATVARLHRDSGRRYRTWPSVERMLALLTPEPYRLFDVGMAELMAPFVARCEQG